MMATRNKLFQAIIPVIFIAIFAAGCSRPQPTPTETSALPAPTEAPPSVPQEAGRAVIESIEAQELASQQIQVVVRGYLTNNCTTVDNLSSDAQGGNIVSVAVETSLLSDASCERVQVPFEKVVLLDNLAPGQYTFVSGASATVEILEKGQQTAQDSGASSEEAGSEDETSAAEPPAESGTESSSDSSQQGSEGEDQSQDQNGTTEGSTEEEPPPEEENPPEEQPPTEPAVENEAGCTNVAAFFSDVTIPDKTVVEPGETLIKTWRVRNEGTCTWGPGYELSFARGESMGAIVADEFPVVNPLEIIDLTIEFVAPTEGGEFFSGWEFRDPDGKLFGTGAGGKAYLWMDIVVNWVSAGNLAAQPAPVVTEPAGSDCAVRNADFENQILQLINAARASQGISALQLQDQLLTAAVVHSTDMACNDFLDHTGSDGSDWFSRITAQGYTFADALENIYYGFGEVSPQTAFDWWMGSEIHRGNILNPSMTDIGIAYAYNPDTGFGYYTLVFASP